MLKKDVDRAASPLGDTLDNRRRLPRFAGWLYPQDDQYIHGFLLDRLVEIGEN